MIWNHLKKPAVLAASLALVVGLAPMAAFADDTPEVNDEAQMTAQDDGPIDSITVNVTQPTAGTSFAKAADSGNAYVSTSGDDYEFYQAHWADDAGELIAGTFEEGKVYKLLTQVASVKSFKQDATVTATNAEVVTDISTRDEYPSQELGKNIYEFQLLVTAKAANTTPAATEPTDTTQADDVAKTDDTAKTEAAPAKETTEKATATEAASSDKTTASSDETATTTTGSTSGSTMPKTGDSLPFALVASMAVMSALALAFAWRLRKN